MVPAGRLHRGDSWIRCLVGPYLFNRSVAAERNAVVSAVALVGAIGVMVRSFQQRHVDILLRDVLDRSVTSLSQRKRISGVRDDAARYRHGDSRRIRLARHPVGGSL